MSGKPSAVYRNRMQRYQDDIWFIWSNKWGCWYRPDCSGYTNDISLAGRYDRQVAALHFAGAVPNRYRVTEPFPLSSVRAMLARRIEGLRAEIAGKQALIDELNALSTLPAKTAKEG